MVNTNRHDEDHNITNYNDEIYDTAYSYVRGIERL